MQDNTIEIIEIFNFIFINVNIIYGFKNFVTQNSTLFLFVCPAKFNADLLDWLLFLISHLATV